MSFLIGCVFLERTSPLKKCPKFDGLSREEIIRQHFPMNMKHSHNCLADKSVILLTSSEKSVCEKMSMEDA